MLILGLALASAALGAFCCGIGLLLAMDELRLRGLLRERLEQWAHFEGAPERPPSVRPEPLAESGFARRWARTFPWSAPASVFATAGVFFVIAAALAIADEALGSNTGTSSDEQATSGRGRGTRQSRPFAEISYVDVGQGDGVVMRVGGKIIVSDVGEFKVESIDSELKRLGATKIDVAILSHPHKDHVKNLIELLLSYRWPVDTAILSRSDYWRGTQTNRDTLDTLDRFGTDIVYTVAGDTFNWGSAYWEVLSPATGQYTSSSQVANSSIVFLLRIGRKQFVFTGDIGKRVARTVATRWADETLGQAAVLLATHHGSAGGSTTELLGALEPKWAVLSTGQNRFHHPSPAAIARLKTAGASIWCTAANGTITASMPRNGRITWRTSGKTHEPWWSATTHRKTGSCVGR